MHGLARKVAGLAEEVSWRSDAAMEWADGDGQRWRAMVLGVWAGRIKDGWMDGSIKIAGFDPADTRKQAEAEAERGGQHAARFLPSFLSYLTTPNTTVEMRSRLWKCMDRRPSAWPDLSADKSKG